MAKHIGIVAVSAEGAALCYRTICTEGAVLMGRHAHPEVTLHCYPLSRYMAPFEAGDWDGVAEMMIASALKLKESGAELLVCPDNTVHQVFDRVVERIDIPWLHIAAVVAEEARRSRCNRVGLLGTRFLMEGPVYDAHLEAAGIEYRIPEVDDRQRINRIIFDELVYGKFTPRSREFFSRVISRLAAEGCDAVILGCTEIPLLVDDESSELPTLDSTRLLARAALREATSGM